MTKKHFDALAAMVAKEADLRRRSQLALDLGRVFRDLNPRFKMERWLVACGCRERLALRDQRQKFWAKKIEYAPKLVRTLRVEDANGSLESDKPFLA